MATDTQHRELYQQHQIVKYDKVPIYPNRALHLIIGSKITLPNIFAYVTPKSEKTATAYAHTYVCNL